ncbi:hypothetical protein C1A50_2873 [Paenibacillus polymyxa]|nr:hypothetical protein C1A50_2873 [Paenibacillus polymyxa]
MIKEIARGLIVFLKEWKQVYKRFSGGAGPRWFRPFTPT